MLYRNDTKWTKYLIYVLLEVVYFDYYYLLGIKQN